MVVTSCVLLTTSDTHILCLQFEDDWLEEDSEVDDSEEEASEEDDEEEDV